MSKIAIKNAHIFKNKGQMIIYMFLFIILLSLFIFLGNLDYHTELADNIRFSQEFNLVPEENVFQYTNAQDTNLLLASPKAIILFGFNNEWVNYYAKIVNEVAIEEGIDKIYYYDFLMDRSNNNGTYETIVNYLENNITYLDNGEGNLYAPTLVIVENRRVTYFDDETAFVVGHIKPQEYWNEYEIAMKKSDLEVAFRNYLGSRS